jgi:predicted kinase
MVMTRSPTPRPSTSSATLYVLIGLPGSGKTTRARELEAQRHALRLTPDEWMIPLFGDNDANGKRDVLEGRFISLARSALRMGISVILDFGVWSRDERSALRFLASEAGASCELVYLHIDSIEQHRRVRRRQDASPESTFPIAPEDLAEWASRFESPDESELNSSEIPPPPDGFKSWDSWSAHRWPSSGTEVHDPRAVEPGNHASAKQRQ